MEFLKSFCKAFRAVVAILKGNIDHLVLPCGELCSRKGQTAVADVLAQRVAAENAEHPLKVEGRRKALSCDRFVIQFLCDMLLNVVNGVLNSGDPIHVHPSCLS